MQSYTLHKCPLLFHSHIMSPNVCNVSVICKSVVIGNLLNTSLSGCLPALLFFFFNRHCNPCGFWPAQLSLSTLSRKVFTECRCQWHVKPPTWRTSDLERSTLRHTRCSLFSLLSSIIPIALKCYQVSSNKIAFPLRVLHEPSDLVSVGIDLLILNISTGW